MSLEDPASTPSPLFTKAEVTNLVVGFLDEGNDQAIVDLHKLGLLASSQDMGRLLLGGTRVLDIKPDHARAREPRILRLASAFIFESIIVDPQHLSEEAQDMPPMMQSSLAQALYGQRVDQLLDVAQKQTTLGDSEGALSTLIYPRRYFQQQPFRHGFRLGRITDLDHDLGAEELLEQDLAFLYGTLRVGTDWFIAEALKHWDHHGRDIHNSGRGYNYFADQFRQVFDILIRHDWGERAGWVVDDLKERAEVLEDSFPKTYILGEGGFVASLPV